MSLLLLAVVDTVPRVLLQNAERQLQFALSHNVVGKTTLYDMEVDHSQRHILTACQDRNIRVYNVSNGKHSKTFKGSMADDGTLIQVCVCVGGGLWHQPPFQSFSGCPLDEWPLIEGQGLGCSWS